MPPMRSGSTSGPVLEEGDGRVDVALAVPAESVRVALALALAAAVEEQHAVAVAGEQLRPRLRADARPGNEITAAPLRDGTYQPLEPQAVARRELDVLVRSAEVCRREPARGRRG